MNLNELFNYIKGVAFVYVLDTGLVLLFAV